ncbi:uncharacterized protein BDZ99DRAFT_567118 [Mytilinidion resinicola]|uniref:MFS general substrate transporter n=1 Tax=Mytilinidion resinicola TaxID=574789 RepID=A0A6A6Z4Q9_9PEZI|nr:uncharacterized protein BDZ99DRAFT_567118 [Mytilinidion resinicola]KAF2815237.1 hypothetical protein BDZ99DRAFT_567118 [Mytilinidion resinicola]
MLGFTASRTQIATYLFCIALFSISFLVFLNSSVSFVITQRIGQQDKVGDAVGTLGFADELVALVACPMWGVLSDRVGVRTVAVTGYTIVGVSLWVFVQAGNVYPQLLLARMFFSIGGAATATMVTAILPTMTLDTSSSDPRSPARGRNGTSHTMAASISSELTITPDRFRSRSPNAATPVKKSTAASTSQLAGLVGMFTGLGALLALGFFLPLPTRFQKSGASPSAAVADAFYVVGAVAIVISVLCIFGLRNLPGEEEKGFRRLLSLKYHKRAETASVDRSHLSYPRLLWKSVILGFKSTNIGLGYLGGFVARASSVAISLFIPLFTNAYFLRSGLCSPADPADPADIKHACPRAYILAAILTGTSQLVALICAPLFGYLAGRYTRFNIPLTGAAAAGIIGYVWFGTLRSPDPKTQGGSGAVFFIVALLGISQIGSIVCSLALLGRGIQNDGNDAGNNHVNDFASLGSNGATYPESTTQQRSLSAGSTPLPSPSIADSHEEEPLLPGHTPSHLSLPASPSDSKSHAYLKGSIAGTYSLAGGAGILLLTKAGGALFDSAGPGSPFFMMAGFNALLLIVGTAVGLRDAVRGGWRSQRS